MALDRTPLRGCILLVACALPLFGYAQEKKVPALDPMATPFDAAEPAKGAAPLDVIKEQNFSADERTVSPAPVAGHDPLKDAVQPQKPLQTAAPTPPARAAPAPPSAPAVATPPAPVAVNATPSTTLGVASVSPELKPVAAVGVPKPTEMSTDPYAVLPIIPIRPVNVPRDVSSAVSTKAAAPSAEPTRMSPIDTPRKAQPTLPESLQEMKQAKADRAKATAAPRNDDDGEDPSASTSEIVLVRPGANTLVTIARDHLNRIATPFTRVNVKTTSNASIDARQSVLYVAPNDEQPIVLYLTQDGQEDPAITLTLMPRKVPPHPVRLTFDALSGPLTMSGSPEAERWEAEQPYIDTLKNLMQMIAVGKIPPGYQLRKRTGADPGVLCADPAIRVEPAQILEGGKLVVTVASVRNISGQNIELQESSCYLPGVISVAAWPAPFLRPGDASELYVVHRRDLSKRRAQRERPSLINELREERR